MLVYRKCPLKLPSTSSLNEFLCDHDFNTVRTKSKQTNNNRVLVI